MTKPDQWRFLLQTFPLEMEIHMASEVMSGLNPSGDKKLVDALLADMHSGRAFGFKPRVSAPEDVIDPCHAPDPFDGCLADDVPVRMAVLSDAEIDRVARLNRAAPDLLNALRLMLDVIHDVMTHAQQRFRSDELGVARAAIAKAAQ